LTRRRQGQRVRSGRVIAVILWVVAGLVGLLGVALWLTLGTQVGTRFALRNGLEFYNRSIPGRIEFDTVRGRATDEVCLQGLRLLDAERRHLAAAHDVCLRLRLLAILGRALDLEQLWIDGLVVHLYPDSTWADLGSGNESTVPEETDPSDELPGPDLGLTIRAETHVESFDLLQYRADNTVTVLRHAGLDATLFGQGRKASVDVHAAWGRVVPADLVVAGLSTRIAWDSPTLVVEHLALASNAGVVLDVAGDLDTLQQRYRATIDVVAWGLANAAVAPTRIHVGGSGNAASATIWARAGMPGAGRADIVAAIGLTPDVSLNGSVWVDPLDTWFRAPIHATVSGTVGPDHRRIHAVAQASELITFVEVDDTEINAVLHAPGARAQAEMRVSDREPGVVDIQAVVDSAKSLSQTLGRLLPRNIPVVEGTGRADARCSLGRTVTCWVSADAARERDYVQIRAEVARADDAIRIGLDHLESSIEDQSIQLLAPASIRIAKSGIDLTHLRVALAGGVVIAQGRVGWQGPSDFGLRWSRINLSRISKLIEPKLLLGRVSGTLDATGLAERPLVTTRLRADKLRFRGRPVGNVNAKIELLDGARVVGRVSVAHERSEVSAFVDLPVIVDLSRRVFRFRERAAFQATVESERFDLDDLNAWVPRELSGRANATLLVGGSMRRPRLAADVAVQNLNIDGHDAGDVRVHAEHERNIVNATVQVRSGFVRAAQAHAVVQLAESPFVSHRFELAAGGTHRAEVEIEDLRLHELERLMATAPQMSGVVSGDIMATLDPSGPDGSVTLFAEDLTYRDEEVGTVYLDAELTPEHVLAARLAMDGPNARVARAEVDLPLQFDAIGGIQVPTIRPDAKLHGKVELHGLALGLLDGIAPIPPLTGRGTGDVEFLGSLRRPQMSAILRIEDLAADQQPLGDVTATALYRGDRLTATLTQHNGPRTIDASATIPVHVDLSRREFTWNRNGSHYLSTHVQALDRNTVAAFVELPANLSFEANAQVLASGPLTDLHGHAEVEGNLGSEGRPGTFVALVFDMDHDGQRASVNLGKKGQNGFEFNAETKVDLVQVIEGRGTVGASPIEARLQANDFQLATLAPVMPLAMHEPRGALRMQATASGTLADARLRGTLRLDDAAITVVPMGQRFTHVNVIGKLDGSTLEISKFSARSGQGKLSGDASMVLASGDTKGELNLATNKLPIVRPGLPTMRLDSKIHTELDATGSATKIDVEVRDCFLDVLELAGSDAPLPIPNDDGVFYVDAKGRQAATQRAASEREPWLPGNMNVSLALANPLRVRGDQADMDWTGRVELQNPAGGQVRAKGEFETRRGRVGLLGNQFDISRGVIRLPPEGELDPYIELSAVTETPEATVTMSVRGRASRPLLELSSRPAMPETDIFSLLVTGHADASEADDADFSSKAAGILAAFQNPALQRYLRDNVGIDRVELGFGETIEQPIATVGKRLTRDIYLEGQYHHNAPPDENTAELRLEYMFKPPHWSLNTFFGDAAEGGIGVWWRRVLGY